MGDQTALLPCPFCGGKASKVFHGYHREPYRVFCESVWCGVKPFTTYRNKPEQAIAEWNTRATPSEMVPLKLTAGGREVLPSLNWPVSSDMVTVRREDAARILQRMDCMNDEDYAIATRLAAELEK